MSLHELQNLGAAEDDDYGEEMEGVDMFGLDEFGMPTGADSMWGAIVGGGLGTGTAIIIRRVAEPHSTLYNYSEALGLLAGGLAGGVMMAFPGSRRMGWAAIAAAFVTNGLRQIEQMLFAKKDMAGAVENGKAAEAAVEQGATPAAFGGVTIDPTAVIQPFAGHGFGNVAIEPGYRVQGALGQDIDVQELGAVVVDQPPTSMPIPGSQMQFGQFGAMPELVGPPQLANAGDYGLGNNPGVAQASALGGPPISGLSMHYGATLFGGQ